MACAPDIPPLPTGLRSGPGGGGGNMLTIKTRSAQQPRWGGGSRASPDHLTDSAHPQGSCVTAGKAAGNSGRNACVRRREPQAPTSRSEGRVASLPSTVTSSETGICAKGFLSKRPSPFPESVFFTRPQDPLPPPRITHHRTAENAREGPLPRSGQPPTEGSRGRSLQGARPASPASPSFATGITKVGSIKVVSQLLRSREARRGKWQVFLRRWG